MAPASQTSFQPAGAGALLAATTCVGIGIGALVGWSAADEPALGAAGGAFVGIPAGIFAVYRRYREYFT